MNTVGLYLVVDGMLVSLIEVAMAAARSPLKAYRELMWMIEGLLRIHKWFADFAQLEISPTWAGLPSVRLKPASIVGQSGELEI